MGVFKTIRSNSNVINFLPAIVLVCVAFILGMLCLLGDETARFSNGVEWSGVRSDGVELVTGSAVLAFLGFALIGPGVIACETLGYREPMWAMTLALNLVFVAAILMAIAATPYENFGRRTSVCVGGVSLLGLSLVFLVSSCVAVELKIRRG